MLGTSSEPMEFASPLLEKILAQDAHVIALRTDDISGTLSEFQLLARRSGQSTYAWSEQHGFRSLKAADITVPNSRNLADALRYVMQSMHFGVYVLTQFTPHLNQACVMLLRQIAQMDERDGRGRKVVLVAQQFNLPVALDKVLVKCAHREVASHRPRLRDGSWTL